MSDETEDEGGTNPSEKLRSSSDQLIEGIENVYIGVSGVLWSTWELAGETKYIQWIREVLVLAIGGVILWILTRAANRLLTWAYGNNVVAGRDIEVQTTLLPLGVSIDLLFLVLLGVSALGYWRVVKLRQRVNQLEDEIKGGH